MTDAKDFGTEVCMRADWLEKRLEELPGKTKTGLAEAIGTSPPRITDMLKGERRIQEDEWEPMALYLEWPVTYLHRVAAGMSDKTDPIRPLTMQEGPLDLKIYACEVLPQGGGFRITPIEQDVVERPSRLRLSVFAFAFWIYGSELSPAFEAGDTAIIDPSRPVRTGDDCLFVKGYEPGTEKPFIGIVRRLLRDEPDAWVVRLYRDESEIRINKADWDDRPLFVYGKYART